MRASGTTGRIQNEVGNLDASVRRSNRAAVAYNKIQMTTASLSAVRGISALRSETQPPHVLVPRVLAIDYGRKRIGLALSDELGLTAQPLGVLVHKNRQDDIRRLREICREHGVRQVVVGHPLHITGEAGEMACEAARFANRLGKELGMPVELADERLTSWEAEQTMNEVGSAGPRKKLPVDAVAAAILLREYLDRKRSSAAGKE
jgi:putative holliday junction resolvase